MAESLIQQYLRQMQEERSPFPSTSPTKAGMTHAPVKTGHIEFPNTAIGMQGREDYLADQAKKYPQNGISAGVVTTPTGNQKMKPPNDGRPTGPWNTAPGLNNYGPEDAEPSPGNVYGARYGGSRVYVNPTPGEGNVGRLYSDTYKGAEGGLTKFGEYATPGEGPFGRSLATQAKIDQRVAGYERAANIIRELNDRRRGIRQEDERSRLDRRANASISLNQGLSGFLEKAADRNYARKRIKELDETGRKDASYALEAAKFQNTIQQQGFENQLALQNLDKGRYTTDVIEMLGPRGEVFESPIVTDTRTGQFNFPQIPQREQVLSEKDALAEATKRADEISGGIANWFTSDQDLFEGKTKEEWIKAEQMRLMGQSPDAPSQKSVDAIAQGIGVPPDLLMKLMAKEITEEEFRAELAKAEK